RRAPAQQRKRINLELDLYFRELPQVFGQRAQLLCESLFRQPGMVAHKNVKFEIVIRPISPRGFQNATFTTSVPAPKDDSSEQRLGNDRPNAVGKFSANII